MPNIYSMQLLRWFSGDESSMQSSSHELSNGGSSMQSSPDLSSSQHSVQTYGLTPDEIVERDFMVRVIQKSHPILSGQEAIVIATSLFGGKEKSEFWKVLKYKLQAIQERLPEENCIQNMCRKSRRSIFMGIVENNLTLSEESQRDIGARILMISCPDLLEEDAKIIATTFLICDKADTCLLPDILHESVIDLVAELKNIQGKFQEGSCVNQLCIEQFNAMNSALSVADRA